MGSLRESNLFVTLESLGELNERIGRDNAGNPEQLAAVAMGSMFTFNTCAYLSRHDMKLPAPPQTDGEIIAVVPLRVPSDYKFLKLVLVEYPGKIVSWLYNSSDGGFHSGEYTTPDYGVVLSEDVQDILRSEALLLFSRRVARELK